ncbi:hypothetical protein NOF55_00540 [Rhizobiaceae bacterium BDR2-2]|uniref:AB hydrolase-1 domain-containing protein n=1 Tax=Ectorhizobium quercum TaxID=2965071 RepID=A0AAE3MVB3_9HYPH|nr:alpha/beta fold hydrolase [Ectorhizobium quercum]MCX8995593.1 hypothetical protein [Ectorhizobium quercum]
MKRLLLAACATALLATSTLADPLPGYDRLDIEAPHRAAPVAASLWYPAGETTYRVPIGENAIFYGTPAYMGAAIREGRHPLVLLSHGSGGNMDNLGWLSSRLALKGAMVLAVNHPGSTSGDSSPRRSVRLAERAADLTAALDQILNDPDLARYIDPSRIAALGFSLGGATALNLAGARADRSLYARYCERFPDAADCVFFGVSGGVDFSSLPDAFSDDSRDPRVTAAIAVDPAITYAMTPESVKAMNLPVLLVNLGGDDLLKAVDVSAAGSGLAGALPQAEYARFAPANHFTFLGLCKPDGGRVLAQGGEDAICDDPQGADRAGVHEVIAERIAAFLRL